MRDEPYAKDEATRLFLSMIVGGRSAAMNAIRRTLEEGDYRGRTDTPAFRLHEWYRYLDRHDKEMVLEVVWETADLALDSFVVTLDQELPHHEMEDPPAGEYSQFAAYLQMYDDEDAWEDDRPSYRSKNINGYPDPYKLYEKYVDASMRADENIGDGA